MTNEQRIKEAARILAKGGRLVIAKNVSEALPTVQPTGGLSLGVQIQVCGWLPDDTVIAIAPHADALRMANAFAADLSDPPGSESSDPSATREE